MTPGLAQSFDDLREFVFPMLRVLGSSLHYDPVLMSNNIIKVYDWLVVFIFYRQIPALI